MDTLLEQVLSLSDKEWQMLFEKRRFWRQVDRSGGPDACWPWMGCHDPDTGYGVARLMKKMKQAHRAAYIYTTGEILDSTTVVRHKCDNKLCCNPAHLETGTHADNIRDWQTRLIDQKGEHNFASKLTEKQVAEIRQRAKNGVMLKDMAPDYGVHPSILSMIIRGRAWKHSFDPSMVPQKHYRLTREQVKAIIRDYRDGKKKQRELAKEYKVSEALISGIIQGKRYKSYAV